MKADGHSRRTSPSPGVSRHPYGISPTKPRSPGGARRCFTPGGVDHLNPGGVHDLRTPGGGNDEPAHPRRG